MNKTSKLYLHIICTLISVVATFIAINYQLEGPAFSIPLFIGAFAGWHLGSLINILIERELEKSIDEFLDANKHRIEEAVNNMFSSIESEITNSKSNE